MPHVPPSACTRMPSMRRFGTGMWLPRFPLCALSLTVVLTCLPPCARADEVKGVKVSAAQCSIATDYDVLVDTGGVWLLRKEGVPREVFLHDGTLSIDQQVRPVDEADAQRLRELEYGARRMMPEAAGLAREAVNIGFDVFGNVVQVLTGSARKARKIESYRKDALATVDGTLGRGRWEQDSYDEKFEARMEAAAEAMSGAIARSVMWQVFTGQAEQMDARADRMDAELDRQVEARSKQIEAHAAAMCDEARHLYAVQQALEYRLDDGRPLELLRVRSDAEDVQATVAAPSAPTAPAMDAKPSTAIVPQPVPARRPR